LNLWSRMVARRNEDPAQAAQYCDWTRVEDRRSAFDDKNGLQRGHIKMPLMAWQECTVARFSALDWPARRLGDGQ